MDLSLTSEVKGALIAAASFPFVLLVICRLRWWRDRNALQFLASAVIAVAAWLFSRVLSDGNVFHVDFLIGLMLLVSALLFYLEVWALLSRGYTLGLLVTILEGGRALTREELSAGYRGGDGVGWIVSHRLRGLEAAGLIRRRDDCIHLTAFPGLLVALGYRAFKRLLGLRRSG